MIFHGTAESAEVPLVPPPMLVPTKTIRTAAYAAVAAKTSLPVLSVAPNARAVPKTTTATEVLMRLLSMPGTLAMTTVGTMRATPGWFTGLWIGLSVISFPGESTSAMFKYSETVSSYHEVTNCSLASASASGEVELSLSPVFQLLIGRLAGGSESSD